MSGRCRCLVWSWMQHRREAFEPVRDGWRQAVLLAADTTPCPPPHQKRQGLSKGGSWRRHEVGVQARQTRRRRRVLCGVSWLCCSSSMLSNWMIWANQIWFRFTNFENPLIHFFYDLKSVLATQCANLYLIGILCWHFNFHLLNFVKLKRYFSLKFLIDFLSLLNV